MKITLVKMYKVFSILPMYTKCSVNISLEYSLVSEERLREAKMISPKSYS